MTSTALSLITLKITMPRTPGSSRYTRIWPPVINGVKIEVTVRSKASEENSGQTSGSPLT